jgi:serine/threonine protein kinase
MDALDISRDDWSILSPLLDQIIELPPAERTKWVRQQTQLTLSQLSKLEHLLSHYQSSDTNTVLDPANLQSIRVLAEGLRSKEPTRQSGERVGPYVLDRLLGAGGMGEVWLAKRADGSFDREVALKFCRSVDASLRIRDRMKRECNVLASLEHPNIARFYDAGIDADGQPYIAMEYVSGVALREYVETRQPDTATKCRIMVEVLSAIQFAHQRLVVHRDLKPSNIMVRVDGSVSLLDFGIAKILDDTESAANDSELTRDAGYALTPAYASPEQCARAPVGTSSDVFSCGVIFYELLAGQRPFHEAEADLAQLLRAHGEQVPQITTSLKGAARRDLNAIVAHALRDDPTERYESASAFADDINRFLRDEPVRAVRGARWYHTMKFVKRNRGGVLFAACSLAALFAAGAVLFYLYQQSETEKLRAQNTERIMSGIFAGLNPVSTDAQVVHPKELMDRSVTALGATAEDPAIVLRIASIYRRLDLPESGSTIVDKSLTKARANSDAVGIARLQAAAAQSFAENRDFVRAEDSLREAQSVVDSVFSLVDTETRWRVALATSYVLTIQGRLREAKQTLPTAMRFAESIGGNALDAVTTTWSQRIEIAKREGDWMGVLRHVAEAEAVTKKYGELDPIVGEKRALDAANANLELGFATAARDILRAQYDAAKQRYPLVNVTRIESALMLAHALARAGELEAAAQVVREISPANPHVLTDRLMKDFLNFDITQSYGYQTFRPKSVAAQRITNQMQIACFAREMFFASIIKQRSELRRIRGQVALSMLTVDHCNAARFRDDETASRDYEIDYEKWIALQLSPGVGADQVLALTPEDRGRLAASYAFHLVKSGQSADAEAKLQFAEDILTTEDNRTALVLGEIYMARAALKMRNKDFASALLQLRKSRDTYQGRLPDGSPRMFLLNLYQRIAQAGLEGSAANLAMSSAVQQPTDNYLSKIPEPALAELNKWLQKASGRDWSTLPLVQL